jgi:hypothetical protein
VKAVQSECREFAISLDLWNSNIVKSKADFHHNYSVAHHYFLVFYLGSKWAEGEGSSYVHHEAEALSKPEFEEKLKSLYGSMFGDELSFVDLANLASAKEKGAVRCGLAFYPVRATKTNHVFETEVTLSGVKQYGVYEVEKALQKQRRKVVRVNETPLKGVASQIDDFQSRSGVLYAEADQKRPTERLVRMLAQAMNPGSSWYQTLIKANAEAPELIRAIYEYLQALRHGLSVVSLTTDEEQARELVSLTKQYIGLVKSVIPVLGPPPPGPNNKADYTHKSIYNYVSLYATEDDELVSPATVRSSHRRTESLTNMEHKTRRDSLTDKPRRPSMTDAANSSISLASPQVLRHKAEMSVARPDRSTKNPADVLARSLDKEKDKVDPLQLLSPPKAVERPKSPKAPQTKQQEDLWKELQGKVGSPSPKRTSVKTVKQEEQMGLVTPPRASGTETIKSPKRAVKPIFFKISHLNFS